MTIFEMLMKVRRAVIFRWEDGVFGSCYPYRVISPADLERNRPVMSYEEALRDDIRYLLDCDAVFFLKGWQHSNGARLEFIIANALKMKLIYE